MLSATLYHLDCATPRTALSLLGQAIPDGFTRLPIKTTFPMSLGPLSVKQLQLGRPAPGSILQQLLLHVASISWHRWTKQRAQKSADWLLARIPPPILLAAGRVAEVDRQ